MVLTEVSVMRHFRLVVILTGLVVAGQTAAKGYADSRIEQQGESRLAFELYRGYLIVLRGSAGPLKGLNFLLDTGASPSVLDPRIAKKLHLITEPAPMTVMGGLIASRTATVPSLRVGPITMENFAVSVQDLSSIQDVLPIELDGIVGLDVLGQSTFVIDYESRQIRFGPIPPMADSIPLHFKGGLALVDAMVNHEQVHLLMDTGAYSMVLFDAPLDRASSSRGARNGSWTGPSATSTTVMCG
jgi:Aspartyl protease